MKVFDLNSDSEIDEIKIFLNVSDAKLLLEQVRRVIGKKNIEFFEYSNDIYKTNLSITYQNEKNII